MPDTFVDDVYAEHYIFKNATIRGTYPFLFFFLTPIPA